MYICRPSWDSTRELRAGVDCTAGSMQGVGQAARPAARQAPRIWPTRSLMRGRRLNPTDRARPGSKHHVLVGANGVQVSAILTGANRNDVTKLLPLVDAIPRIRSTRGRPLRKSKVIYAGRGYDSNAHRRRLRERGIRPVIPRRRTEHGSGLGKCRWVVEGLTRGCTVSVVFPFV
jgi:IS5 family transposase